MTPALFQKTNETRRNQGQDPGGDYLEAEQILRELGHAFRPVDPGLHQLMLGLIAQSEMSGPQVESDNGQPIDKKLRKAEARYRTLIEQIPAVTFIAALDEGINELYVSPQIETLLGFSQKEWLENPVLWYAQLHPDDRERWHLEFAHTCAAGKRFRSEYRFIARDGRVVWVHGEASVVRDEHGRPLFLQGIAFDITERKRSEEALRQAHSQLELRVQERTAELAKANAVLIDEIAERRRVEQQLSASVQEKVVLLKEIHHRVKNNLQVISSLLNLQSGSLRDTATLMALKESQNRVRTMALIHEKMYQSKDLAQIDFGRYVRDLARFLFRSYGDRDNRVGLSVETGDVYLGIDTAIPCGLIINELVSNCLKHAFPNNQAGHIRIELQSVDGECILNIRDDGIGFPPDLDFRQTTSLGLQLVSTLTEQLGGRLSLERNAGTTFCLRFTPKMEAMKEREHVESSNLGRRR